MSLILISILSDACLTAKAAENGGTYLFNSICRIYLSETDKFLKVFDLVKVYKRYNNDFNLVSNRHKILSKPGKNDCNLNEIYCSFFFISY